MTVNLLLVAFLGWAQPLVAHHSFGPEFDRNRVVSVTGKLVRVEWLNPHSYAYIEVPQPNGSKVTYSGEIGPPHLLSTQGWTRDGVMSLVGQTATMRGNPAKDGSTRILPLALTTEKGVYLSINIAGVALRAENGVVFAVPPK